MIGSRRSIYMLSVVALLLLGGGLFVASQESETPLNETLSEDSLQDGHSFLDLLSVFGFDKDSVEEAVELDSDSATQKRLQTLMAWIYPGEPSCDALVEIADGRRIDVLKPEFFRVSDGGMLTFMTEAAFGCNGYSEAVVDAVRVHSKEQHLVVASAYARDMDTFLEHDTKTNEYTEQLVDFVVKESFEGVELDFEDYGGWTDYSYQLFLSFVTRLSDRLHEENKILVVDVPPVRNLTEEAWYVLRLPDLVSAGADKVLVMAYDYQFDHGVGNPIAPAQWVSDSIHFARTKLGGSERLIVGVPSYGYEGVYATGEIHIRTYDQLKTKSRFTSAVRDESSGEMIFSDQSEFFVYQDAESVNQKVETVLDAGINTVSVWHLGGNAWFTTQDAI